MPVTSANAKPQKASPQRYTSTSPSESYDSASSFHAPYSTKIEYDLTDVIVLAATDRVVEECLQLLADDARRVELEESGYEFMTKRDIRGILSAAI